MKPCQHRTVIQEIAGQCALMPDYEFNLAHPQNPCVKCELVWINDVPPTEVGPLHLEILQAEITQYEMMQPRVIGMQEDIGPNVANSDAPSFIQKAASYFKSQAQNLQNGLVVVSDEIYEGRLAICRGCEHYENNHCKICGCKLSGETGFTSKLKLPHERCPESKWEAAPQ